MSARKTFRINLGPDLFHSPGRQNRARDQEIRRLAAFPHRNFGSAGKIHAGRLCGSLKACESKVRVRLGSSLGPVPLLLLVRGEPVSMSPRGVETWAKLSDDVIVKLG